MGLALFIIYMGVKFKNYWQSRWQPSGGSGGIS